MAEKKKFKIESPRGQIVHFKTKDGEVKARVTWEPGFKPDKQQEFSSAQSFVDSECLRYCNPLTPRLTGALIKSGTLGTVIGSGSIEYLAPYARRQYYENPGGKNDPRRGKLWFERMKLERKETIRKGAAKIIGGK